MAIRVKIVLEGFDPNEDGPDTEIEVTLVNTPEKSGSGFALVNGHRSEDIDVSYRINRPDDRPPARRLANDRG